MDALLLAHQAEEAAVLSLVLQQAGFNVKSVRELGVMVEDWPDQPLDLICVTLSGDHQKELATLRQVRAYTVVPMMVIVDPLREDQEVALLEDGIDLVIERPYGIRLLLARIRALLRRTVGMPFFSLPTMTQGDVRLDPSTRTVQVGEEPVKRLTQLEFRLLYTLITHVGQIIPTDNIVENVWGFSGEGNRELVRGLVQRLRAKVEPDRHNPKYIMTEQGIGYYFNRFSE